MPFFILAYWNRQINPAKYCLTKIAKLSTREIISTNKVTNILTRVHPPPPLKIFFEGEGGCSEATTILAHETTEKFP